jgi:hypothetical protein
MESEKHSLNYPGSPNTIPAGGVYLPLGRPFGYKLIKVDIICLLIEMPYFVRII